MILFKYLIHFFYNIDVTIQDLFKKIEILEAEKKQAKEEFGFQRAKMKELFLQKEG